MVDFQSYPMFKAILPQIHHYKNINGIVMRRSISRTIRTATTTITRKKIKKMEVSVKFVCILGMLAIFGVASFNLVDAAGECPRSTPDAEAMKLFPCAQAAQDADAAVPASCCARVKKLGQNPKCLCAVMLSDTAKSSGVKPEIALTIPKRCNFADRPVGYKCGAYTLP